MIVLFESMLAIFQEWSWISSHEDCQLGWEVHTWSIQPTVWQHSSYDWILLHEQVADQGKREHISNPPTREWVQPMMQASCWASRRLSCALLCMYCFLCLLVLRHSLCVVFHFDEFITMNQFGSSTKTLIWPWNVFLVALPWDGFGLMVWAGHNFSLIFDFHHCHFNQPRGLMYWTLK